MKSTEKWFNNEALVGMLLLLLPPLGLYALYHNENVKPAFKNIIYAAFIVVILIFVIRFLL